MSDEWDESRDTVRVRRVQLDRDGYVEPVYTPPAPRLYDEPQPEPQPEPSEPVEAEREPEVEPERHARRGPGEAATVNRRPPRERAAVPAPITVSSVGKAWRSLVEAVSGVLGDRERIWALEAGAGSRPLFDLPEDAFIVGVDHDDRVLEANVRLDQRIAMDLGDYHPVSADFDLISCWYVLDGMAEPEAVLDRFTEWTALGGIVVIAVPNLRSPRGLWLRMTRRKLRRSLTPAALRRRFADHGFTPVFQAFFEDGDQAGGRRRFRLVRGWWSAAQTVVRILSVGLLDAARTDYVVVLRRERGQRDNEGGVA